MPRSAAAYLSDIVESCDAIADVLAGIDFESYQARRAVRSAVEREFIIIGEALNSLRRNAPELVESISHVRVIIGFRNVLTHDYAAVDDETVYDTALSDVSLLRQECSKLLESLPGAD